MKTKTTLLAVALIVLGVLSRFLPHPSNFTAVTAVALWATVLIPSRSLALILPVIILFLSDLWIGFHNQMLWVYGSFLLISVLSLWIEPQKNWGRTFAGSLTASLLFFLISNFGVWFAGGMYPMTGEGLMESYVAGLPFLKNQVAGDLFYSVILGLCARALLARREQESALRV